MLVRIFESLSQDVSIENVMIANDYSKECIGFTREEDKINKNDA